jgi:hypothetical protein
MKGSDDKCSGYKVVLSKGDKTCFSYPLFRIRGDGGFFLLFLSLSILSLYAYSSHVKRNGNSVIVG